RIIPYNNPHLIEGIVTRQNVCQPLAPKVSEASSYDVPCSSISGINSRAINGKVTKIVANTMPGTAKIMRILFSESQGPSQLWAPNSNTYIKPATTGDTAKGKSINVINACLPRNWNLVIDQAAAKPNTTLSGTAIAAANKVSLIAAHASGSVIAAQYTSAP